MLSSIPRAELGINGTDHFEGKFISPLGTWEDYTIGSYLVLVCALAVLLNSMVIYTCLRNWNALVTSDYYILNLACSDIILPLCGFPLAISSSYKHLWIFGEIGCTVYGLISFFFGLVSITTLTTMSFTRYSIICHPDKDFSSTRTTVKFLVFAYLFALLWSVIPLTGWGSYAVEPYGTSCTLQWSRNRIFITMMALCCIITPSIVIVVTYGLILNKCRKSAQKLKSWGGRRSKDLSRKEGHLVKMTFAMCWGFLVSWMPYAVVSMWTAYGDPTMLPTRLTVLAVLLAKTSTVINPTIYFMMSRKFRPMLTEAFGGKGRGGQQNKIEYDIPHTPQTPVRKSLLIDSKSCLIDSKKLSTSTSSGYSSSSSELRVLRIKVDVSSSSLEPETYV